MTTDDEAEPRQSGWPWLRGRLFHLYFLLRRPMTLGARGIVYDEATHSVLLIRHTYVPGWQLPGGGVETGETMLEALERELREEAAVDVVGVPKLLSVYFNRHASRRDHVAVYLVTSYRQAAAHKPDREIAEAGFFPVDNLPGETTRGTRHRIQEALSGRAISSDW